MKKHLLASVIVASVVSGGYIPPASAEPCVFDVSVLPVTSGVVSGITPEGVQLRNGMKIILPDGLLAGVRLNQMLAVRGLVSKATHTVKAFALDGNPPICPASPTVSRGPFAGSPGYDTISPSAAAHY